MANEIKKMSANTGDLPCLFCGTNINDEISLGKMMKLGSITVHYFCMLFSSALVQKGKDNEGLLGFLPKDIITEKKRGHRLRCCYCKQPGATIGCTTSTCRRNFHLPCGVEKDSLHQFFDNFCSYCESHRPRQIISISDRLSFHGTAHSTCPICLNAVEARTSNYTLRAPCCKNSWFHRRCLQRHALSAGYFFKCPLCNNKEVFQSEMLTYGIYIPEQDASWELEENAFQELLYRHHQCDVPTCKCPKGRTFEKQNGPWEIILCAMCGSEGTHAECSKLKWFNPHWECLFCLNITTTEAIQEHESNVENIATAASQTSGQLKKKKKKKGRKRPKKKAKRVSASNTSSITEDFIEENAEGRKIKISNAETDENIDVENIEENTSLGQSKISGSATDLELSNDSEIDVCKIFDQENPQPEQLHHDLLEEENSLSLVMEELDSEASDKITPTLKKALLENSKKLSLPSGSELDKSISQSSEGHGTSQDNLNLPVLVNTFSLSAENDSASGLSNATTSILLESHNISNDVGGKYDSSKSEVPNSRKRSHSFKQTTISPFCKKMKPNSIEFIDLTESDDEGKESILENCASSDKPQRSGTVYRSPLISVSRRGGAYARLLPNTFKHESRCKIELYVKKGSAASHVKIVVKKKTKPDSQSY